MLLCGERHESVGKPYGAQTLQQADVKGFRRDSLARLGLHGDLREMIGRRQAAAYGFRPFQKLSQSKRIGRSSAKLIRSAQMNHRFSMLQASRLGEISAASVRGAMISVLKLAYTKLTRSRKSRAGLVGGCKKISSCTW
jgi:hypothetical protein